MIWAISSLAITGIDCNEPERLQEDAITSKLSTCSSKKMYAMYSQDNVPQVHSKTMTENSLESKMQRVRQQQESIESGGGKCEQESQPGVSSELVADIQSLAKQSRRVGGRKPAASVNAKRHALDPSMQLQFSVEESCNGLQELVIGVSMEWKNSCEPIQESCTNQQSALVTGSESRRLAMNDSTPQPVQETNYHVSTRLVAGTVELSSTLQTEPYRLAMNESTLPAAQETNHRASAKLVAGTVELFSIEHTVEDHHKGRSLEPQNA